MKPEAALTFSELDNPCGCLLRLHYLVSSEVSCIWLLGCIEPRNMRHYCPFLDLAVILTYFKRNSLLFAEVRVELGRQHGKFWPQVREMIWEKAEELFMQEQARTSDLYNRPERCELREGGYFHEAKLIVLPELLREKNGLP